MTNSIKNIQVTYSRTREAYDHKPTDQEYNKMVFEKKTATPEVMLADLISGASTAPIFNKDIIKSKERTNDNFVGSQYWFVDIDFDVNHPNLDYLMLEFTGHDDLRPTFAYSTVTNKVYVIASEYNTSGVASRSVVKRYRLVYVSDRVIYGKERCNAIAAHIRNSVNNLLNSDDHGYDAVHKLDIDTCSDSPVQMMHGNGRPEKMYNQTYLFWNDATKKFVNPNKTKDKKWFEEHTVDEKGNELMLHTTSLDNIGGVEADLTNRIYSFSDAEIDEWMKEYPSKHTEDLRMAKNGVAEASDDIMSMFSMGMQTMLMTNDNNYTLVDELMAKGFESITEYTGKTACNGVVTVLEDYVDPSIVVFIKRKGKKTERICIQQGSRSTALFGIACRTWYMIMDDDHYTNKADRVLFNVLWYNKYFIDNTLEPIERREIFNIVRDALSRTKEQLVEGMTVKRVKKGKKVKGASGYKVNDNAAKGTRKQIRANLDTDCTHKAIQLAMSNVFDRDGKLKVTTVTRELKDMFDRGELLDVTGRPRKKTICYSTVSDYFVELGLIEKKKKVDKNLSKLNVNMTIEEIMDTLGCGKSSAYNYKAQLRHNEKLNK